MAGLVVRPEAEKADDFGAGEQEKRFLLRRCSGQGCGLTDPPAAGKF